MSEGAEVGVAYVTIVPSGKGIASGIQQEIAGATQSAAKSGKAALDDLDKKGQQVGKSLEKMIGAVVGFEAVKKTTEFLSDSVKEALKFNDAFVALDRVMKNQGEETDANVKSMKDYIDSARMATGVSIDNLVPALTRLQAATGDVTKTQDQMNLAMDIAKARNLDLTAVATALGKADQGTMTSLQRLGVAVKDASGNALSLDQVLTNLKATYGGTAAAVANQDPFIKLGAGWGVLKENVGKAILPALEALVPKAEKFISDVGTAINQAAASGDWAPVATAILDALWNGFKSTEPEREKIAQEILRGFLDATKIYPADKSAAQIADLWTQGFADQIQQDAQKQKIPVAQSFLQLMTVARESVNGTDWKPLQPMEASKIAQFLGLSFTAQQLEGALQAGLDPNIFSALYGPMIQQMISNVDVADLALKGYAGGAAQAAAATDAQKTALEALLSSVNFTGDALASYAADSALASEAQTAAASSAAAYAQQLQVVNGWAGTLESAYTGVMDLGNAWSSAKGDLHSYAKTLAAEAKNWNSVLPNMEAIYKKFGGHGISKEAIIKALDVGGPDLLAKLATGGTKDALAVLQAYQSTLTTGSPQAMQGWAQDFMNEGSVPMTTAGSALAGDFSTGWTNKNTGAAAWSSTVTGWDHSRTLLSATYDVAGAYAAGSDAGYQFTAGWKTYIKQHKGSLDAWASTYLSSGASGGTVSAHAAGALVTSPEFALIGEAGAEIVAPVNNPVRTAQLLAQSGLLDRMAGMIPAGPQGRGGDTYYVTLDGSRMSSMDWDGFLESVKQAARLQGAPV